MAENQIRGTESQDCPSIRVTQSDNCPSIRVRLTGGGETPEAPLSDVNFYDYDGKRVASYTAADFAALDAMPGNPSHQGLTAQGWNWSLSEAKAYVAAYGSLNIGQQYTTNDGATRLYLEIPRGGDLAVPLFLWQSVSDGVSIDWGDGSNPETVAGTGAKETTHTYPASGEYVIKMTVTSGTARLAKGATNTCVLGAASGNARGLLRRLVKAEVGEKMGLENYAFLSCGALRSVSIPINATPLGYTLFQDCGSLRFASLPPTMSPSSNGNTFNACSALRDVALPRVITTLGAGFFYNCYGLVSVNIPDTTTTVNGFWGVLSLPEIAIPASVTSISANCFNGCANLRKLYVYAETPPTAGTAFLSGVPSDIVIYVPHGKLADYQAANNWSAFAANMVEMPA